MLLSVFIDYYNSGYLPSLENKTLSFYFPNCNLAARRDFMNDVGMYTDRPDIPGAEDFDICKKAWVSGRKLFFEIDALCFHESRTSTRALIKQAWSNGYNIAFFYRDYLEKKCEIFYSFDVLQKLYRFINLLKLKRFPFKVLIFLSNFFIFNLAAFLILMCLYFKLTMLASIFGIAAAAYATILYLTDPLKRLTFVELLIFLSVTYLINISVLMGNLWGGFKNRMLFLTL